jgi:hypothetical protein
MIILSLNKLDLSLITPIKYIVEVNSFKYINNSTKLLFIIIYLKVLNYFLIKQLINTNGI